MKPYSKVFCILILILACPVVVKAQSRSVSCYVKPHWADYHAGPERRGMIRSANLPNIGDFRTAGREGKTIRPFKYEDTQLFVTAGLDYVFDYSEHPGTKPSLIKLAINVSDKAEKEIFDMAGSAEASTGYRDRWNLSVSKNIKYKGVVYIFTLSCSEDSKPTKE